MGCHVNIFNSSALWVVGYGRPYVYVGAKNPPGYSVIRWVKRRVLCQHAFELQC